jgi:2-deoxy-scyllo-inosamine dehydrogenase (SAM-dependent)
MLTDRRYKSLLEAGIDHFKITSHSRKRHPDRPHQDVLFPEDLVLTNRGGTITHLPKPSPATLSLPCYAPSEMLIVTVTGDILLCYEDAERKHVMGNIMENSLEEIWFSEEFVRYRELLAQGGRLEASEICRSCTNRDHRIPGTSHNP